MAHWSRGTSGPRFKSQTSLAETEVKFYLSTLNSCRNKDPDNGVVGELNWERQNKRTAVLVKP